MVTSTPRVTTRVAKTPDVDDRTMRPKITSRCSGRPRSRLSATRAGPGGLALRPLVPVQPDLDRVREVAADLDERRPELFVPQVEVVAGDPPLSPVPIEIRR